MLILLLKLVNNSFSHSEQVVLLSRKRFLFLIQLRCIWMYGLKTLESHI